MTACILENLSPTSSLVVTEPSDLTVRIKTDIQSRTITFAYCDTQTIKDNLERFRCQYTQDVKLLSSVILWQKKTIDYQALYTAFLLNSVSEEVFEEEAEKFMVHQQVVLPEKIAADISRLDALVGVKFDTSDYADYFQCSQQNMMEALRLIPHSHFVALLPAVESEK